MVAKIRSVDDFLFFHRDYPIYCLAYDADTLHFVAPTFDLLVDKRHYYDLGNTDRERMELEYQINQYLLENLHKFHVERTNAFFWPNTNMHSYGNAQSGVPGYFLTLKDEYKFWDIDHYHVTFTLDVDPADITSDEEAIKKALQLLTESYSPSFAKVKKIY